MTEHDTTRCISDGDDSRRRGLAFAARASQRRISAEREARSAFRLALTSGADEADIADATGLTLAEVRRTVAQPGDPALARQQAVRLAGHAVRRMRSALRVAALDHGAALEDLAEEIGVSVEALRPFLVYPEYASTGSDPTTTRRPVRRGTTPSSPPQDG